MVFGIQLGMAQFISLDQAVGVAVTAAAGEIRSFVR